MSLYIAAINLARRGLRVFPLQVNGKLPAINAFQDAATTDEKIISSWWHDANMKELNYNVGVCTTGIVVMDADVKEHKDGIEMLKLIGGHFDTLCVKSTSGGLHAYYRYDDVSSRIGVMPGVDVRSHNAYVVGPGSVINGKAYEIMRDMELAELPDTIKGLMKPVNKRLPSNIPTTCDTTAEIMNAREWLKTAPVAIQGQGGDARTYQTACKLTRDFGLSVTMAYGLMAEIYNPRCVPPWVPAELFEKIENSLEYGLNPIGSSQPTQLFKSVDVPPPPQPVRIEPTQFGVFKGNARNAMEIEQRPWIADRFLMREKITVLTAAGSAGKSSFILATCAHYALGRDFGAFKLRVPGKPISSVIYNAEDDMEEQARRLLGVCMAYNLDYNEVKAQLTFISSKHLRLRLATVNRNVVEPHMEHVNFLIDTIRNTGSTVFALDPLVNLHGCNENDNSQMEDVLTLLRQIAEATGSAGIIAHHKPKAGGRGERGDVADSRGAGSITTSARIAINMAGPDKEDKELYRLGASELASYVRIDDAKANMSRKRNKPVMWLKWRTVRLVTLDEVGVLEHVDITQYAKNPDEDLIRAIYARLMDSGQAAISLVTAVQAVKAFDAAYSAMPDTTLRGRINRVLASPVAVEGDHIVCARTVDEKTGKDVVLIKLVQVPTKEAVKDD